MTTSTTWRKTAAVVVMLTFWTFLVVPVGVAQDAEQSAGEKNPASEAGLGAAGLLLTIPYGVTKAAFALGGGVVGGLAYLFSGGDEETAKKIWATSAYGTWTITPDHLRGEKPVRFLGTQEETTDEDTLDGEGM